MQNIMRDDSMPEQLNTEPDPRRTLKSYLLAAVLRIRDIRVRGSVCEQNIVWPSWPRRLVCTAGGS